MRHSNFAIISAIFLKVARLAKCIGTFKKYTYIPFWPCKHARFSKKKTLQSQDKLV